MHPMTYKLILPDASDNVIAPDTSSHTSNTAEKRSGEKFHNEEAGQSPLYQNQLQDSKVLDIFMQENWIESGDSENELPDLVTNN